jgi:hypothetical protein
VHHYPDYSLNLQSYFAMNPSICYLRPLCLGRSDASFDLGSNQKNENCLNSTSSFATANNTETLNCFVIATTSTADSVLI